MIIDGVMLLWFALVALSVAYVAIDIRSTPANPVMKWGFVLITLYSGPFGAFMYVLACREPLPGLHEQYVSERWRQVFGSTMHCVAGDGIGILVGAVIGAATTLPMLADVGVEYVLGFGFGWTIFQALFMRDMFDSYAASLKGTFRSELLSMNCLMGGMIPVSTLAWAGLREAHDPRHPLFWFRMSLALMTGFIVAFPMNWWLVANHLKHGMMTVRPKDEAAGRDAHASMDKAGMNKGDKTTAEGGSANELTRPSVGVMTLASFAVFAAGLAIAWALGGLRV
jgi:hypothetical protein